MHATWLYKWTPSRTTALTPIELLIKTCTDAFFSKLMSSNVPPMGLTPTFKIEHYLPGWVRHLVSQMITHLCLQMSEIWELVMLILNFMLFFNDVFKPFLVMVKMTWWLMQFVINCLLSMNSVWMGIFHLLCMWFGSLSQCTEIEEKRCLYPCHSHEEWQCIQAHYTPTSMPLNSLDIEAVSDNDKNINFSSHVEM